MCDSDTLTNIALPWLYTKFGIYPTEQGYYDSQLAKMYGSLTESNNTLDFAIYNPPSPGLSLNRTTFSDVWELVISNFSSEYIEYKVRFMETFRGSLQKNNFGI
jgi:hypothetical protein